MTQFIFSIQFKGIGSKGPVTDFKPTNYLGRISMLSSSQAGQPVCKRCSHLKTFHFAQFILLRLHPASHTCTLQAPVLPVYCSLDQFCNPNVVEALLTALLCLSKTPWFVFFGKSDKTKENNECPNLCNDTAWRVPSSQKGVREQGREQYRSTKLRGFPRVCGEPWAGGDHSSDLQLFPEGAGMRWLMLMLRLAGKWRPLGVNVDLLKRNLSLWGQQWGVEKKKGSWTFKAGGWAVACIFLATHTAVLICCRGLLIFHLCHAKNS